MSYVEYDSNNSGGRWWLKDEDWFALEKAGWKVGWFKLANSYTPEGQYEREADGTPKLVPFNESSGLHVIPPDQDGRWLGALAGKAYRGRT